MISSGYRRLAMARFHYARLGSIRAKVAVGTRQVVEAKGRNYRSQHDAQRYRTGHVVTCTEIDRD